MSKNSKSGSRGFMHGAHRQARAVPVSTGSPQAVSENGNVQGVK